MRTISGGQGVRRGHAGRVIAFLASVGACAALLAAPGATATPSSPPPNPSDQQISQAQQDKDNLASQVGQLASQIADLQARITGLRNNVQLTEQKAALALQRLQDAQAATAAASNALRKAQDNLVAAQTAFDQFLSDSYTNGAMQVPGSGLLTSADPNALLQRGDYQQYAMQSQAEAIDALNQATLERSNAQAAAQQAQNKQQAAKRAADAAMSAAKRALTQAKSQSDALNATLANKQQALDDAKNRLATLNDQHDQYLAWKAEQERIAREKAAAAARAAAAAKAAREAAARAAAARAKQNQGGGSGGGSSVGGGPISNPSPPPSSGGWTAAKGQAAVNRAMQYLGWPYAFAGGTSRGPTYGVCVSGDAWNDCHVYGFDCSGLTMYAWGMPWAHYAATQYSQAGSYHPSTNQLLPGDLLYWSSNGTVSGIHHTALYIGNGNVIQAPQSGSVIQITPLWSVDSGFFGATRPLT
ncbi:MAG: NlpC/P60 family protein [Actinomycetia bacterium]|nr:NlpC/P60 family protein [Actinomycetes bacterium]